MSDHHYTPATSDPTTSAEDEETSNLDQYSLLISLDKTGAKGSGYHIRNPPADPFQRETIIERIDAVVIGCRSREVIHGHLGSGSDDFATLLVYDFNFDAMKRSRRIAQANITFEFMDMDTDTDTGGGRTLRTPEVHAIAPMGRHIMQPSTQEESTTQGGDLGVGVGQLGVNASGSVKWEKVVQRVTSDDTRLMGATTSDPFGRPVGARWTLQENASTKCGVPSFLRTVILLRRKDNDNFRCRVEIEVEADWKTELTRFFGSSPKDDPILFDPSRPPTNTLCKSGYDIGNLGALNISDLTDITVHNVVNNAVKVSK